MSENDPKKFKQTKVECSTCGSKQPEDQTTNDFMRKHYKDNPQHIEFRNVRK